MSSDTVSTTGPRADRALRWRLRWKSGTTARAENDSVVVDNGTSVLTLRRLPRPLRDLLLGLDREPLDLAALSDEIGAGAAAKVAAVLDRVAPCLARVWERDGQEILTCERTARGVWSEPAALADDDTVRLHRFALLRTLHDSLVLESPLSIERWVLSSAVAVAVAGSVAGPRRVADLPSESARHVLELLYSAGMVERADPAGRFPSDTDPALRQWDYHDLLMHARSRSGRFDHPHGAVYPFRGEIPPEPAHRPAPAGRRIPLPEPPAVGAADPPLTEVLETRRSIRSYGVDPMSIEELGAFLYRVGRNRASYTPPNAWEEDRVSRPYPSGGGAYEIDLYLTVRRCAGLDPGQYYYDPDAHGVTLVNTDPQDAALMLNVAAAATGLEARPDVLITLVARFARLSWKYRAIAYAVSLRHVGVVYQTMYLVATAMGLAPCGLGNGDADLAARSFGLDYLRESSVGDFLIGSRPAEDPTEGQLLPGWTLLDTARRNGPGQKLP